MANRTITALYENRADAERAVEKLKTAGFDNVDIHDEEGSDSAGAHPGGLMASLRGLFGGHEDVHTYGEGLRRGHCLLTAKVDDLNETRAATILEASNTVDLERTQEAWRNDGWTAPASAGAEPMVEEGLVGARVRSYLVETPV